MDREHQFQEHVTGRCEYRILLLFDRFEFTDHASHPGFNITGHRLEIDRHTRRTAHHDWRAGEKADARKPPEALRFPAVDSASESLTSNRNAAEMSAALAMLIPWLASARGSGLHPRLTCAQSIHRAIFYIQKHMAGSTTKKRIGRPPTGQRPNVLTRLDLQTLSAIDKLAKQQGVSRSAMIRQLLTEAIEARKKS
jgi:hypothetical protein